MKEIILASNNLNKVRELKEKLSNFDINVISQKEAGIDIDVEETGKTFLENAEIKAKAIYEMIKKPVLADDSGLCIDYLDGAPGVYSHRFAGENATDEDRINKVLNLLKDAKKEQRTARFKCAICYIDDNGEKHTFEGVSEGIIGFEPHGNNGFGYDPLFHYNGDERTFADFSAEEKLAVSHRGRAVEQFIDYITKNV